MKTTFNRIISVFMIALLIATSVPMGAFAVDSTDYTAESQTDIDYQSTNALGDVLSDAMQEDEKQNEDGYYILDVTVEDYTATVEFYAPADSQLIVAVYNEDGTRMITSSKADIDESSKKVGNETELLQEELFFDTELPEYFLLKAFLLDGENKPVCRNFESKKYTKAFQDFLKKETTDFEEEKVINLDESTSNNFAVVSDETKVIEQTAGENTLTVNDFENGIYTFENANSDIAELKKGDVFYYIYGEGSEDYILTKIGSIQNSNGAVTITAAEETEISDFFSYIKIDTEAEQEESEEQPEEQRNKAAIDINPPQAEFTIGFSQGFESGYFSGSATGQVSINVDFRFYYDFKLLGKDYYNISNRVEYTSKSELELSASAGFATDDPVRVVYTIFPITAGLNGTLTVGFNFSAEAKISVSGTLEFSGVNGFRNVSGQKSEDLTVSPKAVYKFNASVEGVITITPIVVVDFIALGVVDVGVGAEFDIEFTIKLLEVEVTNEEEEEPDIIHTCAKCIDCEMTILLTIFAQAEFGLTENTKLLLARLDYSLPEIDVGVFYISFKEGPDGLEFDKFDWGECPNKKYRVNVTVLDKEDKPIQNAVITEATKETVKSDGTTAPAPVEDFTTDESGKATAYFPIDEHSVRGKHEEFVLDNERMTEPEVDFVIEEVEEEEEYEPIDLTIYMELEPDGQCGDYAYYSIFDDKILYIFGEGDMWDYDNTNRLWYVNRMSIDNLVIDYGITSIGDRAFCICNNLQGVTIGNSVTTIGDYAFADCDSLQTITIPDSVTTIGKHAFSECRDLRSVTIGNSVTRIDDYAFETCRKIQSVTIPDSVTTIGSLAFSYCAGLQNVTIGNSVTTIGEYAFSLCNNLKNIKIPDSVTAIGNYAFSYCHSLQSVTIGNSVITIGDDAFHKCNSLQNIIVDKENKHYCNDKYGVLFDKNKTTLIKFPICNKYIEYIIPDSVISIGWGAFGDCNRLEHVTIGNSVTTIGDCAFANCYSLSSVEIPNGVTQIGYSAFFDCKSLISISIPISVTRIGSDLVHYNTIVYYPGTLAQWEEIITYQGYLPKYFVFADESRLPVNNYALNRLTNTNLTSTDEPNIITQTVNTVPDFNYVIAVVKSDTAEDLLNSSNLLYIDQKKADGETLSFSFTLDENITDYKVLFFSDEAHTHSYEITEQPATCKEEGTKTYTCSCGDTYTETIPVKAHTEVTVKGKAATCTATGLTDGKKCSVCGTVTVAQQTIPKTDHTYTTVTTKATLTADGKTETRCSTCGDVQKTETIAKVKSLTLSATSYIYDGKNKTPKVTIKDSEGKVLTKNVDYKLVVASKRAGIGRYTVKVTFMGNYSGSKSLYFYILPGKPATVKSASQGTTSNKLTWSAVPGAVGYTLYYYSNSKKAYVKINTTTNTTYTVKGLLTGTKYTFKIVTYGETASGKVYDSETYALLKSATKTKTPELTKVTASSTKGKAYVYHTDVKGETGYTVYYSTSSTTGFKKYANFKADATRCDITKLTSGKTYYFKVRTYIKTDSGYVYSPWSAVKGVKVK